MSVFPLSFPYSETENSKTVLNRVILTDEKDLSRYSVLMKDGACNSIDHLYTATNTAVGAPLRYVASELASFPLLLSVPTSFSRLKLHLTVSQTTKDTGHLLTILKTWGHDNEASVLQSYLEMAEYTDKMRDVSQISLSKVILSDNPEVVVVNDSFDTRGLRNQKLNVSVWEQAESSFELAFSFLLWVDDTPAPVLKMAVPPIRTEPDAAVKTSTFTVSDFCRAYNFSIEDGPEFRSQLLRYEQSIPKLKRAMQSFHEEVRVLESGLRRLTILKSRLLELIDALGETQFNPLFRKLKLTKRLLRQLQLMFHPMEQNIGLFLKEVLCTSTFPKMLSFLHPVIAHEASELTLSKKAFERTSKEYYEWLNKYLANEKDRTQQKLLLKRKVFETSKFDYLNTLNSALNNQYFNQLLENLLKFSRLEMGPAGVLDFSAYKKSQLLLTTDDTLYLTSLSRFNSEKLHLRQMIEACRSNEELMGLIRNNPLNTRPDEAEPAGDGSIDLNTVFPAVDPISVQSPAAVSPTEENGQMSGILYALGGKGKPGWHKEWVVLRGGQLVEFSDWRKGQQPINKPVDIALSNVKATTHDKRQFCFEIVTSQKQKHVFQATSKDELTLWMRSLYHAGQITLNLVSPAKQTRRPARIKTKFDSPLPALPPQVLSPTDVDRVGSPVSIVSTSRIASSSHVNYLDLVRSTEGANNSVCADCGSSESVEWVSANILMVMCVQCSLCHRNMGSHVSKVRSLRLDHFEHESLVLLEYVNNAAVNAYLQHTAKRIGPDAKDDERLTYIKQKYEQRAFMEPVSDLDSLLVQAVRKVDIHAVVKCLNCGADPNLRLQVGLSTDANAEPLIISLFEYSLRKAVKVAHLDTSYFVVSELLLLHGCNIEGIDRLHSTFKFSDEARAYWEKKRLRVA